MYYVLSTSPKIVKSGPREEALIFLFFFSYNAISSADRSLFSSLLGNYIVLIGTLNFDFPLTSFGSIGANSSSASPLISLSFLTSSGSP